MSFQEYSESVSKRTDMFSGTVPPLGGIAKTPRDTKVQVRYFSASIDDPEGVAQVESIMTRSLEADMSFDKAGDVVIIREDTTFTSKGEYVIAIKYMELVSTTPEAAKKTATDTFDDLHAVKDSASTDNDADNADTATDISISQDLSEAIQESDIEAIVNVD